MFCVGTSVLRTYVSINPCEKTARDLCISTILSNTSHPYNIHQHTMFIVFWGPLAAIYRLKWWALAAFLPSMLVMGLGLGLDKTPGQPSEAAYLAAAITSASLLITFGCWFWWALWWDLERVYRIAPWKQQQDAQKDGKGVLCPFTGLLMHNTFLVALCTSHHRPAPVIPLR